jgi:hypothetical protein
LTAWWFPDPVTAAVLRDTRDARSKELINIWMINFKKSQMQFDTELRRSVRIRRKGAC